MQCNEIVFKLCAHSFSHYFSGSLTCGTSSAVYAKGLQLLEVGLGLMFQSWP